MKVVLEKESISLRNDIDLIREELETFTSTMRLKSHILEVDVTSAVEGMEEAELLNPIEEDDDFYWTTTTTAAASYITSDLNNSTLAEDEDDDEPATTTISTQELNEMKCSLIEKDRIISEYKKERTKIKTENRAISFLQSKSEKELNKARRDIDHLRQRVNDFEQHVGSNGAVVIRGAVDGGATASTTNTTTMQEDKETMDQLSSSPQTNSNETTTEPVRVALCVRPSNTIELSLPKLSTCNIELDHQYNKFMVDSPSTGCSGDGGGEYEFSYDKLFDAASTNSGIWDYINETKDDDGASSGYAEDLLRGINCCVMAIGGFGSGKTYALIGKSSSDLIAHLQKDTLSVDDLLENYSSTSSTSQNMNFIPRPPIRAYSKRASIDLNTSKFISTPTLHNSSEVSLDLYSSTTYQENPLHSSTMPQDVHKDGPGILPRLLNSLFTKMRSYPTHVEFTIKVSFLAIHLEKMFDLLDPNNSDNKTLFVSHDGVTGSTIIEGATQAFCFTKQDIMNVITQGHICHSILSRRIGVDPCYWHTIIQISIHTFDSRRNVQFFSQFHLVELSSQMSSLSSSQSSQDPTSSKNNNKAMVNKLMQKSFTSLTNVIKRLTDRSHPNTIPYHESKLTSLLTDILGGNCRTTLLVTTSQSPITSNITNTLKALRFGQRICRAVYNTPHVNMEFTIKLYRNWLLSNEIKLGELVSFVQELSREFVKDRDNYVGTNTALWDSIWSIVNEEERHENPCRKAFVNGTIHDLLSTIPKKEALKWKALSTSYYNHNPSQEFISLVTTQKRMQSLLHQKLSQVELLKKQLAEYQHKYSTCNTLFEALQIQNKSTQLLCTDLEYKLIVSQFREKEALIFLKHIRALNKSYREDLITFGSTTTSSNSNYSLATAENMGDLTESFTDKFSPIEVISSTYIAESSPTLKELIDVDSFLLEAGLLDRHDFVEQPSANSIANTTNQDWNAFEEHLKALHEFVEKSYNATKEIGISCTTTESQQFLHSITSDTNNRFGDFDCKEDFTNGNYSNTDPSMLLSFSPWLAYIKHLSKDALGIDAPNQNVTSSSIISQKESSTITKAVSLTNNHKSFISPREKQLEKDIGLIAKKCLELKMKLDEVMILSRYGNLKNNRLAQETLVMKEKSQKCMADTKVSAWKLQELQVMNKALQSRSNDAKEYIKILENHLQKLQHSFRENVLSSQENQSSLSNKLHVFEALMNSLFGISSADRMHQEKQDEDRDGTKISSVGEDTNKNDKKKALSTHIDVASYAFALINLPICGYKTMIEDQRNLQQFKFMFGNLNELSDLYLATLPDYLRQHNKETEGVVRKIVVVVEMLF